MPDPAEALLIGSLGIYGGTGHFLLTRAFRLAPASTLSPFLYVQLIFATALGWLVFGQLPDGWALAGMAVIAASGLGEAPWRRLLDRSRELRTAYADLASWHECTEHSP